MTSTAVVFMMWLSAAVIAVMVAEYAVHRWVMHRPWRFPAAVRRVWTAHAVFHHGRYYRFFRYEPDPLGRRHNLRLNLAENWVLAAVVAGPLWWVGLPEAAMAVIVVVTAHCRVWNAIHVEMHDPKGAWISRTGYFQARARQHWLHHLHKNKNYAVVFPPLLDWLFGTYAAATADQKALMKADRL